MPRTIKNALVALVASLALAPAALADQRSPASVRIAYGDLDMTTVRAGETLLKRIDKAASKVCGERWQYSAANPYGRSACRIETVDAIVQRLDLGTLDLAWNKAQPSAVQTASR